MDQPIPIEASGQSHWPDFMQRRLAGKGGPRTGIAPDGLKGIDLIAPPAPRTALAGFDAVLSGDTDLALIESLTLDPAPPGRL